MIGARVPDLEIATGFDDATLSRHLPDAEILRCFQFPAAALARAERLRWIQLTSAGAEQLLPARAWLSRVTVTNTRGIHVDLMADYALGMIAMLQWDVPRALRDQQARTWEQRLILPLAGQTLLVVGAGAIGSEIARRGAACGLDVVAVKRTPGPVEGAVEVVTADRLADVLPCADFVVLVVPITAETRHMIGEPQLRAMRFVTSRAITAWPCRFGWLSDA
jgi:phosphoglycerate dehydrogenase-like enzyme